MTFKRIDAKGRRRTLNFERAKFLSDMYTLGYRVYRYRGGLPDLLFCEVLRYSNYPGLIFVKDKIIQHYG